MKKLNVGGQAVIEGVMMKADNSLAVSVRKKGKIITKREKLKKKSKFFRMFFIRGIVNLIEILVLGIKSLMWSADQSAGKDEKLTKSEIIFTLLISIGFVILFFVALPYFLTHITGIKEEINPVTFNLIDGLIKIALFLIYLLLISLMKDVRRLFQYHGAEHKAVYCYEANKKLTLNNAKKFSTLHPRCGTSFLMIVLIISVFVFSLLPVIVIYFYPGFLQLRLLIQKSILFPLRIFSIPVIAGISYEILKLSDKFRKNPLIKLLIKPGLLLQKITTKEPTNKQIEVALKSLKRVLKMERIKTKNI
jgi:uncharacterized protein YqhQ